MAGLGGQGGGHWGINGCIWSGSSMPWHQQHQPPTPAGQACGHTLVSYCSGSASMKACALAARAAASTCSSLASGRPYLMFSALQRGKLNR